MVEPINKSKSVRRLNFTSEPTLSSRRCDALTTDSAPDLRINRRNTNEQNPFSTNYVTDSEKKRKQLGFTRNEVRGSRTFEEKSEIGSGNEFQKHTKKHVSPSLKCHEITKFLVKKSDKSLENVASKKEYSLDSKLTERRRSTEENISPVGHKVHRTYNSKSSLCSTATDNFVVTSASRTNFAKIQGQSSAKKRSIWTVVDDKVDCDLMNSPSIVKATPPTGRRKRKQKQTPKNILEPLAEDVALTSSPCFIISPKVDDRRKRRSRFLSDRRSKTRDSGQSKGNRIGISTDIFHQCKDFVEVEQLSNENSGKIFSLKIGQIANRVSGKRTNYTENSSLLLQQRSPNSPCCISSPPLKRRFSDQMSPAIDRRVQKKHSQSLVYPMNNSESPVIDRHLPLKTLRNSTKTPPKSSMSDLINSVMSPVINTKPNPRKSLNNCLDEMSPASERRMPQEIRRCSASTPPKSNMADLTNNGMSPVIKTRPNPRRNLKNSLDGASPVIDRHMPQKIRRSSTKTPNSEMSPFINTNLNPRETLKNCLEMSPVIERQMSQKILRCATPPKSIMADHCDVSPTITSIMDPRSTATPPKSNVVGVINSEMSPVINTKLNPRRTLKNCLDMSPVIERQMSQKILRCSTATPPKSNVVGVINSEMSPVINTKLNPRRTLKNCLDMSPVIERQVSQKILRCSTATPPKSIMADNCDVSPAIYTTMDPGRRTSVYRQNPTEHISYNNIGFMNVDASPTLTTKMDPKLNNSLNVSSGGAYRRIPRRKLSLDTDFCFGKPGSAPTNLASDGSSTPSNVAPSEGFNALIGSDIPEAIDASAKSSELGPSCRSSPVLIMKQFNDFSSTVADGKIMEISPPISTKMAAQRLDDSCVILTPPSPVVNPVSRRHFTKNYVTKSTFPAESQDCIPSSVIPRQCSKANKFHQLRKARKSCKVFSDQSDKNAKNRNSDSDKQVDPISEPTSNPLTKSLREESSSSAASKVISDLRSSLSVHVPLETRDCKSSEFHHSSSTHSSTPSKKRINRCNSLTRVASAVDGDRTLSHDLTSSPPVCAKTKNGTSLERPFGTNFGSSPTSPLHRSTSLSATLEVLLDDQPPSPSVSSSPTRKRFSIPFNQISLSSLQGVSEKHSPGKSQELFENCPPSPPVVSPQILSRNEFQEETNKMKRVEFMERQLTQNDVDATFVNSHAIFIKKPLTTSSRTLLGTQAIDEFDTETLHLVGAEGWSSEGRISEIMSEERYRKSKSGTESPQTVIEILKPPCKKAKFTTKASLLAELQEARRGFASERRTREYERLKNGTGADGAETGKDFHVVDVWGKVPVKALATTDEGTAVLVLGKGLLKTPDSVYPGCWIKIFPPWHVTLGRSAEEPAIYSSIRTCVLTLGEELPCKEDVWQDIPMEPYLIDPCKVIDELAE